MDLKALLAPDPRLLPLVGQRGPSRRMVWGVPHPPPSPGEGAVLAHGLGLAPFLSANRRFFGPSHFLQRGG